MTDGGVLRAAAPAKINRELRVGPPRPDGFHDIRSRFAAIDLADALEARPSPDFSLSCEPPGIPADETNLVARAARALAAELGRTAAASVSLLKRVPIGAGLGGGSSDAAATLRLLCRLWRARPDEEALQRVAASLGSDVPFFLFGGEADVTGRGERIVPRPDAAAQELTIVVPPFSIPTPFVYAAFDRLGLASELPARLDLDASGRFFGPNDLESAIVAVRPEMANYLADGRRIARECAVTGSGSAVVLVGALEKDVAALLVRHAGARALAARTIGRDEFRRLVGASADSEA